MPATLEQSNLRTLIEQLRIQHQKGADMADVYKAIDALRDKDDEVQRIQRMLQGTAETALLGQPATLFALSYRKEGLTWTAYGLVKRNGHVTIELGHGWPISTSAESMLDLQERLAKSGIAYAIAYTQKSEITPDAENAPDVAEPPKKPTPSSRSFLDYLQSPRFA
jgi:hypothetical protein